MDSDGDVYVADWGNSRVQIFEPNGEVIAALTGDANTLSKAQQYVGTRDNVWQSIEVNSDHPAITDMGRFGRVTGIEVTDDDPVIVTDSRGRLQVYAKDKNFVLVLPP